jgi:hypothetical protein
MPVLRCATPSSGGLDPHKKCSVADSKGIPARNHTVGAYGADHKGKKELVKPVGGREMKGTSQPGGREMKAINY